MKKLLATLFTLSAVSVAVAKEVNFKLGHQMFTVVSYHGLMVQTWKTNLALMRKLQLT